MLVRLCVALRICGRTWGGKTRVIMVVCNVESLQENEGISLIRVVGDDKKMQKEGRKNGG